MIAILHNWPQKCRLMWGYPWVDAKEGVIIQLINNESIRLAPFYGATELANHR